MSREELPDSEPYCTHSQMVNYINETGEVLALAHRYLRLNNEIGGSGKPDPKLVVIEEEQKILCYKPPNTD